MKTYIKALHILSWIPLIAIKLALALLGLFTVPLALQFSEGKYEQWPDIFWVWGNDESKGVPQWFLDKGRPFPNWWWYAVRNPVNNMRFVFKDRNASFFTNWQPDLPMEAQQMIDAGQITAYRWSYNGPFAGYRRVWLNDAKDWNFTSIKAPPTHYSEIWFGWKVGSGVPGMGFTTQVRLKRKIGT